MGESIPNDISFMSPAGGSPSTTGELFDTSIIADRETSMHVTGWVRANYVQEKEHNVPRRNMFEHYKAFCTANDLTPVNSATFGKLLRVVFPELKTRRLGVRGQSKYHYCGIRVRRPDDAVPTVPQQLTSPPASSSSPPDLPNMHTASGSSSSRIYNTLASPVVANISAHHAFPQFTVPVTQSSYDIGSSYMASFTTAYQHHCEEIYSLVTTNQVQRVRGAMQHFYHGMSDQYLRLLQNVPELTEAVWRWDCYLYDALIMKSLPSVNYQLTHEMVQCLRSYTREINAYVTECCNNAHFPANLYQKKSDVARIFAAKFRRQLSLNFAAQTATAVLSMQEHLSAMKLDWEQLDIDGILDQTLWVCECDTNEIRNLLKNDVYELLTIKTSLNHWVDWVSGLTDKFLNRYVPATLQDFSHYLNQSKLLLLKWTFYMNLVMKDLTYQQARSFASFQSVRLFLDDYVLYVVESQIANVNHQLMQQQASSSS